MANVQQFNFLEHLMKFLALSLIAFFQVATASAGELNLVCDRWINGTPEYITVIVGNEREVVALEDSYGRKVSAKQYAVIIELVLAKNGGAPKEIFSVRTAAQFRLSAGTNGYLYSFQDMATRKSYSCELNQVVVANPALTRSNR